MVARRRIRRARRVDRRLCLFSLLLLGGDVIAQRFRRCDDAHRRFVFQDVAYV